MNAHTRLSRAICEFKQKNYLYEPKFAYLPFNDYLELIRQIASTDQLILMAEGVAGLKYMGVELIPWFNDEIKITVGVVRL